MTKSKAETQQEVRVFCQIIPQLSIRILSMIDILISKCPKTEYCAISL